MSHVPGRQHLLPEPERARWQVLRAGIQNIWEYDDQRFQFHRGRLLLRGGNESGKTKALEVLLPFLLDANLSPQRLDPFGSRSRPMKWNLINDDTPEDHRIGYVWIELGRRDGEQNYYLTLGAGLRAKRANPDVEDWYFITKKRIDLDLHLLDEQRVPLVRSRLAAQLGDKENKSENERELFEKPSEYRRQVNKRLFGLSDEQYSALIDTLLQLRRPQLAKQLDPSELGRILTASLPTLKREKIESLAEGFERLDRHSAERDASKEAADALGRFLSIYRRYAAATVKARSQALTQAESAYHGAREESRNAVQSFESVEAKSKALDEQIGELERAEREQKAALQAIERSKEFLALKDVQQAEADANAATVQASRAEERLARDQHELSKQQERLDKKRGEVAEEDCKLQQAVGQARLRAREAELTDTQAAVTALAEQGEIPAARGTLDSALEARKRSIKQLEQSEHAVTGARKEHEQARAVHQSAEEATGTANTELDEAKASEKAASDAFVESVVSWAADLDELRLDGDSLDTLLDQPVEAMRTSAEEHASAKRRELLSSLSSLKGELQNLERQMEQTEAEEARLRAQTHAQPPLPAWRSPREPERPGAPLYLLCEYIDPQGTSAAAIEAALEASGMLDAWIDPDGQVWNSRVKDCFLLPQASLPSERNLLSVLRPTPASGVAGEVIEGILRSIELCDTESALPEESVASIASDGRFRIGPLCGRSSKLAPDYIGATAREQARQRRLSELAQILAQLEEQAERHKTDIKQLEGRLRTLDGELRRFPPSTGVLRSHEAVKMAAKRLQEAIENLGRCFAALQQRQSVLRAAESRRDQLAAEVSLTRWTGRLGELRERIGEYQQAAHQVLLFADHRLALRRAIGELENDCNEALRRYESTRWEAEDARREANERAATARALRETLGIEPAELLRRRERAAKALKEVEQEHRTARAAKPTLERSLGELAAAVKAAKEKEIDLDGRRKESEAGFKRLAQRGLLRYVEPRTAVAVAPAFQDAAEPLDTAVEQDPSSWTYSDTLRVARRVDAQTPKVDCSATAREKEENHVTGAHQDLHRSLPKDVAELLPERSDSVLEYSARRQGRICHLLELARELADDAVERDSLLSTEEQRLINEFLSGELYEHLADCLRRARGLIDNINRQLEKRQTASGMQLRLKWEVDTEGDKSEQIPAGAPQAIELMLRTSALLSDSDRDALAQFMKQRLATARNHADHGTLQHRLFSALDYRVWFRFTVESLRPGGKWREVNKKVHGEGSGGQKAVILHLPLFAAVKAFYVAADGDAPHLILLDEAFAGIDRKMKGRLMGCLREFDLDFMMTSFDEWGFYEELDGLATYELMREQGLRGVYTEWFLWDGRTSREMGPG